MKTERESTPTGREATRRRAGEHRRSALTRLAKVTLPCTSLIVALVFLEYLVIPALVSEPIPFPLPLFTGKVPNNSLGFRDFEYAADKGANQFRILVFGDSFTRGAGVNLDDTYPKRLERYLNAFAGDGQVSYQVLNLGINRRSTPEEAILVRTYAEKLAADLLIVGYVLNDAEDWIRPRATWDIRRRTWSGELPRPSGVLGFVYEHSALGRLVIERFRATRLNREQLAYYRALYEPENSGWRRTKSAFRELGAYAGSIRKPLVFVVFPLFGFGLGEAYPFRDLHDLVHQALDEARIPHLDLLSEYYPVDERRFEAVPYEDPHPSEIGHRVAAEALWSFLIERKLVPVSSAPPKRLRAPKLADDAF